MGRKSRAMSVMQAEFVTGAEQETSAVHEHEMYNQLTPELQSVIAEIDQIFGDVQVASLTSFWRVGRIITDVKNNPSVYLTPEQQSAHVDGASLLFNIFAPVYTVEQLRGAVGFFEKYPSEGEISRLLGLRCPERPRWRMTVSHVQLLAQVPDDSQRAVLEDKCAEAAYTARNLALELQELRGKQRNTGRPHRAPKGLKQQLLDLLQYQRRFIARSEKLWLAEQADNIYDDIVNTPPEKFDAATLAYFAEIRENFDTMSDMVADHRALCAKVQEEVLDTLDNADENAAAGSVSGRPTSDIVR